MEYFAREQRYAFLPSLLEIAALAKLTEAPAQSATFLSILASDLTIDSAQLKDAVEHLAELGMVRKEDVADNDLRISLLEEGRKYYNGLRQSDATNEEACKSRLRHIVPEEPVDKVFETMESWIRDRSSAELLALLGGDEEVLKETDRDLQKVFSEMRRIKVARGKPIPPIYLRTLGYLVSAFVTEALTESSRTHGIETRIILDTNVIDRLLEASVKKNPALHTLGRVLRTAPHVEFWIAKTTLKELGRVFEARGHRCSSWQLHGPPGLEQRLQRLFDEFDSSGAEKIEKREIPELIWDVLSSPYGDKHRTREALKHMGALGLEFFTSENSPPTFRDFTNWKMLQLRGKIPLSSLRIEWKPKVFRTGMKLKKHELENALAKLRDTEDWGNRPDIVELHDIALLLYADRMNAEDPSCQHIIWTHHLLLSQLAEHIGVDPNVILFGPGIIRYGHPKPELMRDYMRFLFLSGDEETLLDTDAFKSLSRVPHKGQDRRWGELIVRVLARMRIGRGREREDEIPDPVEDEREQAEISAPTVPDNMLHGKSVCLSENGWVDLSMEWGKSPGGHGTSPLRVLWLGDTSVSERSAMQWQMSPHAVTHLDLPWALDTLPALAPKDHRARRETQAAQRYAASLLCPCSLRAVFVNLTDLAEKPKLKDDRLPDLESKELEDLIWSLRIDSDILKERLPDSVDLADALLVLHTGWAATFMPDGDDLSSLTWEAAHPWTLHPWLSASSVTHLLGREVRGIALDALMPDCPMYAAGNIFPQRPNVKEAAKTFFPDEPPETDDAMALPPLQPTHVEVLRNFKILAESLDIPDFVKEWYPKGKSFFETDVFLSGLHFAFLADAAPIKILAKDPRFDERGTCR